MPSPVATDSTDARLWLYDPARAAAQWVTQWKHIKLSKGLFGADTLVVTVPYNHIDATYSSDDAGETDFGINGTQGLWSFDYYHRGTKVFSGPVVRARKSHRGADGTAYFTLKCESWGPYLLRGRQVRTSTGAVWINDYNQDWRDIGLELIAEQCVSGSVVTPTGWQQNSEVRTDFGPFTVAVASYNSGTSGSLEHHVENRTNSIRGGPADRALSVRTEALA